MWAFFFVCFVASGTCAFNHTLASRRHSHDERRGCERVSHCRHSVPRQAAPPSLGPQLLVQSQPIFLHR